MLSGKKILVMGLLDTKSIAWAIGQRAEELGAEVTYTVQNERFRDVLLRRSFKKDGLSVDDYRILPCDVTSSTDIENLFGALESSGQTPLAGLVHSIAFANPKSCLTNNMFDAVQSDLEQAFTISAASLALVVKSGLKFLSPQASVIALSFNTMTSFPGYDWMGVCKAGLEATTRYIARDLGKQQVRANCISAGPLNTKAATSIPGFGGIRDTWNASAPLGWNPAEDQGAVADTAAFLLSNMSRKITGEVIYVDGGFHSCRGV